MVREYSALRYVVVWGGWYHPMPIGGWYSLFSMGRVKSGWLSKFWCVPELFWMSPEWSGPPVLFWMVSEWSGHHWMPLAGCPRLETQLMSFGQKVCRDPWSQYH